MYRNASSNPIGAYFSQTDSPIYSGAGELSEEQKRKVAVASAGTLGLVFGGLAVFFMMKKKSR